MALTAGELQILVDVNTRELDTLKKKLNDIDGQSKKTQGGFKSMAASFFTAQAAFSIAEKGLSILKDELIKSVRVARDFEEANNKFRVTFRAVGKEANVLRKNLTDAYGLSRLEATNLLAATGDLLTGFGFQGEAALNLSNQVQQLAVDLASFQNLEGGAQQASEALTKALLGETESAKSLGIVIRAADVNARLAAEGKDKLTGQSLLQAQAEARLQIALEQSKNAIGDYARTTDSLANRQRTLKAVQEDVAISVGSLFLPVINKITGELLDSAQGIRDWLGEAENVKNLRNAISVVSFAFFTLLKILKLIATPFFAFANNAIIAAKALGNLGEVFKNVIEIIKNPTDAQEAIDNIKNIGSSFVDLGKDLVDNYKNFGKTFLNTGVEIRKDWDQLMKDIGEETGETLIQETKPEDTGKEIGEKTGDGISKGLASKIDKISETFSKISQIGGMIANVFQESFTIAGEFANRFFESQLANLEEFHNAEIEAIDARLAREIELIENNGITKAEAQQAELEQLQEALAQETDLKKQADIQEEINSLQQQINIRKAETRAAEDREKEEKKFAKKKYKLEVEQFNTNKGLQAANAAISFATGLISMWASVWQVGPIAGPILGGIFSGLLTGIFAAQLASILSQAPPPPPKFQQGGQFIQGGQAIVGEAGPEIAEFPGGTNFRNARETRNILGGEREPQVINIVLDGEILRSWLITNKEAEAVVG